MAEKREEGDSLQLFLDAANSRLPAVWSSLCPLPPRGHELGSLQLSQVG